MKRFISILLAALMCVSVLGGIVVAGAENAAEEKSYVLAASKVDKTIEGVYDSTLTGGSIAESIVTIIGYGTHGFKYWTADAPTYAAAPITRALQLGGRFRMYANYGWVSHTSNNDGMRLALALEKPGTVPSFYKVFVDLYDADDGYADIWMRPLDENNKDITYYQATEAKNGASYATKSKDAARDFYLTELIYNNGTDDNAIAFYTGRSEEKNMGLRLEVSQVKLMPVTVSAVNISLGSSAAMVGETTKANVYATLSDKKVWKVTDSYVTYKSSDESIAKIAPDGTITALKAGKVDITATVGEYTKTFKNFTVGYKAYNLRSPGCYSDEYWDSTITGGSYQVSIIPLIGYGHHGYKYWTSDDVTYASAKTERVLQLLAGAFRMFANNDGALTSNNDGLRVALAFEHPKTEGFYRIDMTRSSSGTTTKNAEIYVTPLVENNKDITYYQSDVAKIGDKFVFSDTTTKMPELIYNNGTDDHVISFYTGYDAENECGSNIQLETISFVPVAADGISLAVDAEELDKGSSAKAKVTAMNGKKAVLAVSNSYVEYESSDKDVATIDADGTINVLDYGTTVITAKAGGFTSTQTLVIEKTIPEPGEELTETVTFGVDNSRSLSYLREFITAPGYTVGSPAQVAVGTKVTLTAKDADDEGFKFRFWKVSGRFYSTEKQITLTIARNTSVIAVYDDVFFTTAKYVEFWNGDKDFISEEVTLAETLDAKYFPKDPEMTGMRFIGWYLDDETPFTPETVIKNGYTRVAAKYETIGTEYTVKVNGEENKGKYNSPVSVSAPEAFTYWKLGEEKLSFRRAFEFFNYGNAELISVFDESAKAVPTVVIDKNLGAAFITYDTPAGYERIEVGIIFGSTADIEVNRANSKANAQKTAAFGQFTAKPMNDETYARGYQIFKKDGVVRVIYTDAIAIR